MENNNNWLWPSTRPDDVRIGEVITHPNGTSWRVIDIREAETRGSWIYDSVPADQE